MAGQKSISSDMPIDNPAASMPASDIAVQATIPRSDSSEAAASTTTEKKNGKGLVDRLQKESSG